MKVLYSQLKKYLPALNKTPKEIADAYTEIGFMLDKMLEVNYQGKEDFVLDLEVRQNRVDCFGVIGLARELSAYYNIPLVLPEFKTLEGKNEELPIAIAATDAVKRVTAIKIANLKVSDSPQWLIEYLAMYDINSVNNLVDITNYVMLETAYPSHAFDTDLMGGDKLVWELNNGRYSKFNTLSGEELSLTNDALVISDGNKPLSLGMIGGKEVAINKDTKNIILEIGVYNGGLIRRNGRAMKVLTEAGSRLEKNPDPESSQYPFTMLVNLILEHCGGEVASQIYDNYLQKHEKTVISVNLDKVQQIAGMPIGYEESKNYLERLGFGITTVSENELAVTAPEVRTDIEMEEDVFEEIIRLKGFYSIPTGNLNIKVTKDVTPSIVKLIDQINAILSNNSFDEVRSWVLVDPVKNDQSNFRTWEAIRVTNSINEEVPILRQSISVNLFSQFEEFKKNNISPIGLFEIGKVFGMVEGEYKESYSLGIISDSKEVDSLRIEVELLLRALGFNEIVFDSVSSNETIPQTAHPKSTWNILVNGEIAGLIYISNSKIVGEGSVAELDIDLLDRLRSTDTHSAREINQKIVSLDSNLVLASNENINSIVLERLRDSKENIWAWEVVDQYSDNGNIKYTVRVSYVDLSDEQAKELHTKLFA